MVTRQSLFIKKLIKPQGILEGRWYTGRKTRQIWAEWAVCVSCYLQNPSRFDLFFLMKNDCLVTIFHEFIVKCVWKFFSYQQGIRKKELPIWEKIGMFFWNQLFWSL